MALVAWCREAGVAEGGLAARPGGDVVAAAGELGPGAPGEMALAVDAALGAAGAEARAVAVELSGRWVTGFRVAVPGGDVLVCLRGKTAVRADLRDALAAWAGGALRGA